MPVEWARVRSITLFLVLAGTTFLSTFGSTSLLRGAPPLGASSRFATGDSSTIDGVAALSTAAPAEAREALTIAAERIGVRASEQSAHIVVLLGTRPEAVKLAPVILALHARRGVAVTVVSTGQHATMLDQVLSSFGLKGAVDLSLNLMQPDQTLEALTARAVDAFGAVLRSLRPGLVLVQGDTTSAFVGALAAFYQGVPVGHVEAGLRTWNIASPFPEEFNRQAISLVAALHFAATDLAAQNLASPRDAAAYNDAPRGASVATGHGAEPSGLIFVTGNPVVDALRIFPAHPPSPLLLAIRSAVASRCGSSPCRLVLLTAHRRENHGAPLVRIMDAVSAILARFSDVLIAYPVHLNPNVRASIRASVPASVFGQLVSSNTRGSAESPEDGVSHWSRLLLSPPLDYPDLVRAENESSLIITDSGGIQEEGAVLGKFTLVLRENTERPEGVLAGIASLVGTDTARILAAVSEQLAAGPAAVGVAAAAKGIYGDGFAAQGITDLSLWFLSNRSAVPPLAPFILDSRKGRGQ